jgi:hypothetical protein
MGKYLARSCSRWQESASFEPEEHRSRREIDNPEM